MNKRPITFRDKDAPFTLPEMPPDLMVKLDSILSRELNEDGPIADKITSIYNAMQIFEEKFVSSILKKQ